MICDSYGNGKIGNGPNTVSESTVSNTELSEFFGPHRVPGRELSELLSAYYLCAKTNSPSFFAELTEFAPKLSEFFSPKQYSRNSIPLPFPRKECPHCGLAGDRDVCERKTRRSAIAFLVLSGRSLPHGTRDLHCNCSLPRGKCCDLTLRHWKRALVEKKERSL